MTKEIVEVVGLLDDITAIKSEIVDRTPFDSYEGNWQLIHKSH